MSQAILRDKRGRFATTSRGLREFQKKVQKVAKTLPEETLILLQKKIAIEAMSRLIAKTPVDTGRARGGWILSLGAPSGFLPEDVELGVQSPSHGAVEGGALADASGKALETGLSALASLTAYEVVYVQNNIVYIGPLDQGHSRQAPQGMLRPTLSELSMMFQ